jgi:hypothetical protein
MQYMTPVHPPPLMPRWATALRFVIPTGAYPDFLLRGPHQRPRVRLSVRESRMNLANATNLHRKSGVAQRRDLRFTFGHKRMRRGRIVSGFRFSIKANRRSLRCATLRSG